MAVNDRDGNRSNPYKPDPAQCCEACAFGRGEHARWCEAYMPWLFPLIVPSDCDVCPADELGLGEAIGYTEDGLAICGRCAGRLIARLGAEGVIA